MGKKNQETCEDGIAISDNHVAVIDGSTSKTPFRIDPSMANGRLAMSVIRDYISHMPEMITCEDFLREITRRLHLIYIREHIDIDTLRTHPEKRLTASAAVYSRYHNEVWLVGDCQTMVNGTAYDNEKPYEKTVAAERSKYIGQGYSPQEARKMIVPQLVDAMKGQNVTYAVIDGFPIPATHVKVIPVAGDEVVLASDGYPFICPTLAESERKLENQLQSDPQNIKDFLATKGLVPRNHSFDDRAYIRFKK